MRGVRLRKEPSATENLRRLGDGVWRARPSTSTRPQPTSRHPNDAPRGASVQAGLQTGNGEQPKPRQCAPKGATAERPRFSNRAEHPAPIRCAKVHQQATVTATQRSGEPLRTSFERWRATCSTAPRAREPQRLKRWCQRRCEDAVQTRDLVTASGRCAPPFGETVETSIASAYGLRAHRQSLRRQASDTGMAVLATVDAARQPH